MGEKYHSSDCGCSFCWEPPHFDELDPEPMQEAAWTEDQVRQYHEHQKAEERREFAQNMRECEEAISMEAWRRSQEERE